MLETLEKRYRALRLYKSGKYDEAREVFEQILEQNPQSAQDWYYKAHTSWKLGFHDEAIISLNKIKKSSELKGNIWFKKGLIYREQNNLEQSIHCLSIASNLYKDHLIQLIINWEICKLENKEDISNGLMINNRKSIQDCLENMGFLVSNISFPEIINPNQSQTNQDIEFFILNEINRQENQEFDKYIEVTLKKASALVKRERKCC
ncbi:MAG: tetratricopeptide repeat protein [Candidatus Heimdallarchaeota archaeon]|nr:tetratricopeptide repeat protein [Candidatus Heimdallarchaeota archaeon]